MLHKKSVPYEKMAAATHLTVESDTQQVKVVVLGASRVGKSSIVRQFVCNHFTDDHNPTTNKVCYYPSVIINDHLYEVKIIDCPAIPYFPLTSFCEWSDYRGYCLRNATAYILVFDITNDNSFQYIRSMREQILDSVDGSMHDVSIMVVGNKHDLVKDNPINPKRETANVVKKQWKCGYIECSAKYNWHILTLFKELMKSVDNIDYGHKSTTIRVQDALRRNRCTIL